MLIKLKFIVDITLQSRYRHETDQGSKNHINTKIDPKCMDVRKFNANSPGELGLHYQPEA